MKHLWWAGIIAAALVSSGAVGCGGAAPLQPGGAGGAGAADAGPGAAPSDAGLGGAADAGPGAVADAGSTGAADAGAGGLPASGLSQLSTSGAAVSLALDDHAVYWVESYSTPVSNGVAQSSYSIQALQKGGAGSPLTLITEPGSGGSLVAEGGYLYWIRYQCLNFCQGAPQDVSRLPIAGGAVERLATFFAAERLAVDGAFVYLANNNRPLRSVTPGGLWRIPRAGGAVEEVVANHECSDARISGDAVLINGASGIKSWSRTTGKVATLATPAVPYRFLKPDGADLFLASFGGEVQRAPLAGGEAKTLWKAPAASLVDLDAQGGVAYWAQAASAGSPSCIGRANADGTDARCLDSAGTAYLAVRVDDTAIYFVRDGDVWRSPR
jgi:hypothetical protein